MHERRIPHPRPSHGTGCIPTQWKGCYTKRRLRCIKVPCRNVYNPRMLEEELVRLFHQEGERISQKRAERLHRQVCDNLPSLYPFTEYSLKAS